MKKELSYIAIFLLVLIIIFFVVRFFKVTDSKIISAAEKAVASSLYDPYSAKFSDVVVKKSADAKLSDFYKVCGQVNSKNPYGAYTGNKPFSMSIMASGSKTIKVVEGTLRVGSDDFTSSVITEFCTR
ncbi:Uncharacterised protein [Providencia rettgeri]|nr:Uncharacterised protein [Providencia rettgeri]